MGQRSYEAVKIIPIHLKWASDHSYFMEGYQCQKSTLCNKRSNIKECGINKKERGILQPLA